MAKHAVYSILIFIFLINTSVYAQQDVTAEQIVKKYVEKLGGEQRWNEIHSTQFRDVTELKDGDSVEFVIIKQYPNKYYQRVTNQKDTSISIYNAGVGVSIHNGKIDTIHDAAKLDNLKLQSCILPDISYQVLGYKMELQGIHKFSNMDCYEIQFTSPNGTVTWNYYDTQSGLLRMVYQEDKSKTIFPDYEEYKGCLYPSRMFYVLADGRIMEVKTKSILVNEKVDPAVFK
ncbi:MAG: hypothetical protein JST32_16525, partial [Bacteroidetes bacterium]|nr:hypothetical protein [Bacteroidota bacterium]